MRRRWFVVWRVEAVVVSRFLVEEPAVIVPGRLAGPVWSALNDALARARRDGRQGLGELEALADALMAASLAAGAKNTASDVGRTVDVGSSDGGRSSGPEWVTTAEAAVLLGLSDRRVRQLLDAKQLVGRWSGGVRLVDVESVRERKRRADAKAS